MTSLLLTAALLVAAPAPSVALSGAVPKPMSFTQKDLEALGPLTATWKEHEDTHDVRGVPLDKLLRAAGFDPGPMGPAVPKREKRAGWKMAVRATAPDGFQALFSCAELWEGMGPTRVLLVWEVDGKALGEKSGPFRLVVLTDQEPSRSVHNVSKLEVLDLRS
jgi:hypothetical protein